MHRSRRVVALAVAGVVGCAAAPSFAATDLSITKTGPGAVKPGDDLVYTIVVTNLGPDSVRDAQVGDPTPAGLSFVSNTGDCATAFPCNLTTMIQGDTRTITARFHVPASYSGVDPIVNMATVTTSVADTNPGNNMATASTAITRVRGFFSLPPCRVLDTRGSTGVPIGGPAFGAGEVRILGVRELCGLPGNAIAISFNLTITGPTSAGDLRLYPGAPSLTSAINYVSGQTRANNGIVPLAGDGSVRVQCDQGSGTTQVIMDVNGYFADTDAVPTPVGKMVRVRPAPEVEITFDDVTVGGGTSAQVIEFPDNRPGAVDQDLKAFFPPGSPLRALVPSVIIPSFVVPLGKGSAGGTPTFLLGLVDTTAAFSRTAEFHGLEKFRLGWDPPCVVPADPTQEPRTFYAPEALKGEPSLVEDAGFGGPVFVDISSGCGSNKGAGWNFSLYLTGRDTRPPVEVARYMLQRMEDALSAFGRFITNGPLAANLLGQVQAALATLDTNSTVSITSMNNFIALVDGNPGFFVNTGRNVSGELVGRALSARYMLGKVPTVAPGTITEFPVLTPNSQLWGIGNGPDGNVWFTERNANKIGRITTAGVVTEFPVPTATSQPNGVSGGPDGNVWFSEDAGNKVGRITPAGVITEFTIQTASSSPTAITAGPDGNLWFVERVANQVGRITTAGVITEFRILTANTGSDGIAAGPDGNLWFTEFGTNQIGRITTTGVITEFPIPTANSGPQDIAPGPDGNLWFTEFNSNKIGRITTAGVVTEFPLALGAGPSGITAGADGNLWFTERAANKIGRITTAGVVTEFPIPVGGGPRDITKGADGNLWFTETNGNNIGRMVP